MASPSWILGANVGVYSLFVAGLAGRKARVLAVEPQPEIYRRLAFNVAANDLGTIRTMQCAVADRDGTLDLFIDRGNRGQSSIAMVTGEKVSVPCRTLESVLNEAGFDRVDALKIDIEGAEDTVLVPFFATAPSRLWPSLILLETSSDRWKSDCVALCIEHGYRETHRTRLNVILERTPSEDAASYGIGLEDQPVVAGVCSGCLAIVQCSISADFGSGISADSDVAGR